MAEYAYGYYGMPCALCTRYRTEGKSRCPGCSRDGYYTEPCKVHHCCREKSLSHCGACESFPCVKLGKMGDFSDLNTGRVKERTCKYIAANGFDAWYQDYARRADCGMNIDPHKQPNHPECIRCSACKKACPNHAISIGIIGLVKSTPKKGIGGQAESAAHMLFCFQGGAFICTHGNKYK